MGVSLWCRSRLRPTLRPGDGYLVLGKSLGVLSEAELLQPISDLGAMDDGLPMREKFTDSSPQNTLVNFRLPTSEPFQPLHPPWRSCHLGPKVGSESPTSEI